MFDFKAFFSSSLLISGGFVWLFPPWLFFFPRCSKMVSGRVGSFSDFPLVFCVYVFISFELIHLFNFIFVFFAVVFSL